MKLDEIVRSGVSRLGIVRVKSAMNPFIYLALGVPPLCWAAAYVFFDDLVLRYALVALGAVPVALASGMGLYYGLRDPDRLQSEEYQLQIEAMRQLWRRGVPQPLPADDGTTRPEALPPVEREGES